MKFDRRSFLKAGLAGMTAAGVLQPAFADDAGASVERSVAGLARSLLAQYGAHIPNKDFAGIVDFAAPSWRPRFHLVDMEDGRASSFLVSHGRGSDPGHSGWLRRFSNKIGSNATSSGAYRTDALYVGKHGRSMRLKGLDTDNSNAERRAIVVHAAWYVSDEMIDKHGKLGRSEGCFALSDKALDNVLERLGPGRLLYAGRF